MESAENQAQSTSGTESESNINPPLSKAETIALLNDSIDRLEETIKKISGNSGRIPSSDSINTLLTTTQALEAAVATPSEVKVAKPLSTQKATDTSKKPSVRKATSPASVKASVPTKKKNNTGLIVVAVTAIAIAIVTVFWLWKPQPIASLFPKSESTPTEVAVNLDTIPAPAASSIDSENLDLAEQTNTTDFPAELEPVAEPIEDVVKTIIPPELTSPGKPKNLKMVTIKPELNFTSEQNFIAALETKLGEITQAYPSELIQNVKVNLPESSLVVEVTDDWYELDELRQNSLGNEMLKRSRVLSFDKLQLKDKQGILLARNPIIGENIVILQSKKPQLSEDLG